MFRVLIRELLRDLLALVALAGAGVALAVSSGDGRVFGLLWLRLPMTVVAARQGEPGAITALVHLGAYGVLALLALWLVLRRLADALVARRRGYSLVAHLAQLLRLRVVRLTAAVWGVALAVVQGGSASAGTSGRPMPPPGGGCATMVATPSVAGRAASPTDAAPGDHGGPPRREAAAPVAQPAPRGAGARVIIRRTVRVRALRYTVQPGDTLGDIAYRLNPADPLLSTRIFRASRGLPQEGLPPLADPDLIFPGQTLLVPLPLPHVAVVAGRIQVQVQAGDTEGAIAARFLGDWRRYPELTPVHATVPDPNLIHAGLTLQLPASAAVAEVRLARRYVPRLTPGARPNPARVRRPPVRRPAPPASPVRRLHVVPRSTPAPAGHGAPGSSGRAQGAERQHRRPARIGGAAHAAQRPHPARRVRPKRHVRPVPRRAPVPPQATPAGQESRPVRPAHAPSGPTALPAPTPPIAPTKPARPVAPSLPVVRMPGAPRYLPLALLAALALLVAAGRRHGRRRTTTAAPSAAGAAPPPSPAPHGRAPQSRLRGATGLPLSTSMRRTLAAVNAGVGGSLLAALRRTPPGRVAAGHLVPSILAVLDDEARGAGLAGAGGLAAGTRAVIDGHDTVTVHLDATSTSVPGDALAGLVTGLTRRLGTPVQVTTSREAAGSAIVTLTMRKEPVLVAGLTPPPSGHHPAPLLVPLGLTTDNGRKAAVVYVNLARSGALLLAGGAQGANTLVATLLADVVAQARPSALRLLIATDDDEVRRMAPVLDHLDAPAVDAARRGDVAALVDQANTLVLDRFTQGASGMPTPAYLLVLCDVEELCRDARVADRLDTICRNGADCGVHVIATTGDVAALTETGMLDAFPTRLARPLPREDSMALFEDGRAATLAAGDVALALGPHPQASLVAGQMTPFLMTLAEVQEAFAWTQQAQQIDVVPPPSGPDAPGERDDRADREGPAPNPARPSTPTAARPTTATAPRGTGAARPPETDQVGAAEDETVEDETAAIAHAPAAPALDAPDEHDAAVGAERARPHPPTAEAEDELDVTASSDAPSPSAPVIPHAASVAGAASVAPDGAEASADAVQPTRRADTVAGAPAVGPAAPPGAAREPVPMAQRPDAPPPARSGPAPAAAEPACSGLLPVQVRVFGGIRVLLANGTPIPKLKPREQRLLAALAILPSPVRADRLLDVLWPDDDDETARNNLDRSISDIRAALARVGVPIPRGGGSRRAGAIVLTSAGYQVDADVIWTDTRRFQHLLRQAQGLPPEERGPALTEAVDLYTGDLCGDQSMPWVDDYTWSWRKDFVDALYDVTVATLLAGDLSTALRHARRLVTEEPLVERHHELLFEILARRSDRGALVQAYEEMCAAFEGDGSEHAGTEVDPEIHRSYARLLASLQPASPPERAGRPGVSRDDGVSAPSRSSRAG